MKNIIYLATVLCICITGMYSCKKNSGIPHYTIDADLKTAFDFKPGTYWIYRDSISGRVDSFAVRTNTFSTPTIAGNYSFDIIKITMTEYIGGSSADTSGWQINLFANCEEIIWFNNINFNGQEYIDLNPMFSFPFKLGLPLINFGIPSGEYNGIITNIYSNYIVNSINYNSIAEINFNYANGKFNSIDWFYECANIGIIKMRLYDSYYSVNKVWELQTYYIVK